MTLKCRNEESIYAFLLFFWIWFSMVRVCLSINWALQILKFVIIIIIIIIFYSLTVFEFWLEPS